MTIILSLKQIKKNYQGATVLNGLTMDIKRGEIYGLIGKNGCGKTTLFRIMTGLIPQYGGTFTLPKTEIISANLGFPALFMNLSAVQNMTVQNKLLQRCSQEDIVEQLNKSGLDHRSKQKVKDFSLGMMQRLKLALSLLSKPTILILDEPLNGLDPEGIVEFREAIKTLNSAFGITIIISSHLLSELENVATTFAILSDGVISELTKTEMIQNHTSLETLYLKRQQEVTL